MSAWPAGADADDHALWHRIKADNPLASVSIVTPADLRALAEARGTDYATAALYLRLREVSRHRSFIADIDSATDMPGGLPAHMLIVPGAFHHHHRGTGADGGRVMAVANELGRSSEVVPVGSLSSLAANAETLIAHLLASPRERIVLVSLSKGSADVAVAMAHPRATEAFARVVAWVSLSGLTFGTPLIDWLQRQWWRMPAVHGLLWWKGLRFAPLAELRRDANGPLGQPPVLPSHLAAVHVIGFPRMKHLRHPWAPRGHRRLLPLGPNDGGGILLGDVERLPGWVYPVWGADHYLDPPADFSPVLRRILLHAATSQTAASATPAIRSSR